MANKFVIVPEEIYRSLSTSSDTGDINLDAVRHELERARAKRTNASSKNVNYSQQLRRYLHMKKEHDNRPSRVELTKGISVLLKRDGEDETEVVNTPPQPPTIQPSAAMVWNQGRRVQHAPQRQTQQQQSQQLPQQQKLQQEWQQLQQQLRQAQFSPSEQEQQSPHPPTIQPSVAIGGPSQGRPVKYAQRKHTQQQKDRFSPSEREQQSLQPLRNEK
uniref:Uncharacterized protein n=1 Tax=Globodera pallida TaxID=36090 RepID=A0A183CLQ7_GLOPA